MRPDKRTLAWVLVGALIAGLVMVQLAAVVVTTGTTEAIRASQRDNASVLRSAERAAEAAERGTDRIEGCTTPGRGCFDRGQEETAAAVADINRVAVYAAACADKVGVQGEDEIFACVIRLLDRRS